MRKIYLVLLLVFSFSSVSQEIDRSNYQLLWEISGNNLKQNSYLFGTFHSNDNEMFDFPDSLYVVLNESEAIVLETDLTETMDEAEVINNNRRGSNSSGIEWVVPELKSNEITYTSYGSDEGRPQFIDLYFKQIADNCGKDFYQLESIKDQMKIGLNNEYKKVTEGHLQVPSKEDMKRLYLEGNASELHDITKLSTVNYVDLYEDLITNRNKIMVDGIDTLIQNQKVFCAVGAAHLMGVEGIIPLLRKKGYEVRAVNSSFSKEKSKAESDLDLCRGYMYKDLRFGFSLQFSGKPKVKEEELGSRLIQYQEMGQGNTYSIRATHYETIDDLDRVAADFFKNDQLEVVDYKKVKMPNGITAHEGKIIEENGQAYWMRTFHKNEILYLVFCTGGHRFVNSSRPQKYFESFEFKKVHNDVVSLDSKVFSPTKTLSVKLPKGYLQNEEHNETDKYWRAKWFNPNNGENFYAYENVLADNSIYFTDDHFGEYLISEFDSDSVFYYGEKSTFNYAEKSFSATKNGKKAYGRIRLIGNMLHFVQYTGKDSTRANQFISSMNFNGFQPIDNEVQISNKIFEASVTKSGFKPLRMEEKYGFRTTKHYFLNDMNNVIAFEVYVKTFEPWAFSRKSSKQLLQDQIIWPSDKIPTVIDTTVNLSAENPYLDFEIIYTSSKNRWKGRTYLNGRKIITYSQTQPVASEDAYSNLTFLDSISFDDENGDISQLDLDLIIQEIDLNGTKNIKQLSSKKHIDQSAALEILFLPDSIFQKHDEYGVLQGELISNLKTGYTSDSLTQLWKKRSNQTDVIFTEQFLSHLASSTKTSSQLRSSIQYANDNNFKWNNFNDLFVKIVESEEYFDLMLDVFEEKMKDSISWKLTFLMEEAMQHDHFKAYFFSDSFEAIALNDNQGDWVSFRYFELLYEFSENKTKLKEIIADWDPKGDEFNLGVSIAWKEIIKLKSKLKMRKKVASNIFSSTAYAKVMAVTNQQNYDLYNYEEIIGLIAFDHYEDDFFDVNKSLEFLQRFDVKVGNKVMEYALFKCIENKKVYYLTRKVDPKKNLPSYKDFGSDSHFFQYDHPVDVEQIRIDLEKRLKEVYGV